MGSDWIVAPSGWEYRVIQYEGETRRLVQSRRTSVREGEPLRDFMVPEWTVYPEHEDVPPCDRETVEKLWSAP